MQKKLEIIFRSAHGDRGLLANKSDSVVDVCRKYGIPTTQISIYLIGKDGQVTLSVKPTLPMEDY
ncbi:MAG TPA: hypothetical protein VGC97_23200, partial [Pyrinomonadaceae bacterium]